MTFSLFDLAFVGSLTGSSAYDADAQDYINRVIAADVAAGNSSGLEVGVQDAYNAFFVDCKSDGMLNAIKASCILAGARTLAGALVPLVGAAPTSYNFVAGDYNRETGLVGNGSTKYLNSNRSNNADPQNSKHLSVFVSTESSVGGTLIGQALATGASHLSVNASGSGYACRLNSPSGIQNAGTRTTGFAGLNRSVSTGFAIRSNSSTSSLITSTSATPATGNILVFNGFDFYAGRLAFYSIGESLDLALLDSRVTDLMNALAAAIP